MASRKPLVYDSFGEIVEIHTGDAIKLPGLTSTALGVDANGKVVSFTSTGSSIGVNHKIQAADGSGGFVDTGLSASTTSGNITVSVSGGVGANITDGSSTIRFDGAGNVTITSSANTTIASAAVKLTAVPGNGTAGTVFASSAGVISISPTVSISSTHSWLANATHSCPFSPSLVHITDGLATAAAKGNTAFSTDFAVTGSGPYTVTPGHDATGFSGTIGVVFFK